MEDGVINDGEGARNVTVQYVKALDTDEIDTCATRDVGGKRRAEDGESENVGVTRLLQATVVQSGAEPMARRSAEEY